MLPNGMKCPCHTQLSDMMVEALPCAPSETPPGAALAGTRHLLDFFVAALWPGASESSLQRNSQLTKHLHSGVCCMPSQLGRDASYKTVTFMQVQNVQPSKAEMLERHLARARRISRTSPLHIMATVSAALRHHFCNNGKHCPNYKH